MKLLDALDLIQKKHIKEYGSKNVYLCNTLSRVEYKFYWIGDELCLDCRQGLQGMSVKEMLGDDWQINFNPYPKQVLNEQE